MNICPILLTRATVNIKPFDLEHIESRPEPKNFMTAPLKKGLGNTTVGHLFSKPPEYIPDPYDRLKESHSVIKW
jgi:hypothetical protein